MTVRARTTHFSRIMPVSFLLSVDYASGLTNINNKTPGRVSGRFSLVEPFAVAKGQTFRNPLTF
jgi:hypothetical protein